MLCASLLAACGAGGTKVRTPDAPVAIDVLGTANGETIVLHHESGVSHRMLAADGVVHPPLLIDGAWRIETDGSQIGSILVGTDPDKNAGGKELLACWTGEGAEPPRTTTPEGVRCTQSLVLRVATERGYQAAAGIIEEARRGLGADRNLWGRYCNIAGDAAAMGAVLAGEDGRELIRTADSFCDYSVLHGVGAGIVLLNAENPVAAVRAVCAPDPLADLPTISRTSQCWHGAGTGFARTTRLDLSQGERLCREAPEEASRLNCIEGLFSFTRTYALRGESVRAVWPGIHIDGTTCNRLEGSPALLETCYRSGAQTLVLDASNAHADSGAARESAVGVMLSTCSASTGDHTAECWSGLGTLVASALHPDLDEADEVRRWLNVCSEAPTSNAVVRCFERAALGILANDQLVTGLTVEEIVELVPEDLRTGLREKLTNWSQTLGGRSN